MWNFRILPALVPLSECPHALAVLLSQPRALSLTGLSFSLELSHLYFFLSNQPRVC